VKAHTPEVVDVTARAVATERIFIIVDNP
jgi:hypothetical protein